MTDVWQERGSVDVPSGTLAYAARGEGTPVILLHKLGGWIAEWDAFVEAFPEGMRLIAIDLHGHGGSRNRPPETWEYRLDDGVAELTIALDALSARRASFVGNSRGGHLGMILAATQPDRVDKLVISSSALRQAMSREKAKQVDDNDHALYDVNDVPVARPYEKTASFWGAYRPDLNDDMNRSRIAAGPWVRWWERGGFLYEFAAMLPDIAVPTCVLFGDADPYIPKYEEVARQGIPNVSFAWIPGAGRFPHQEKPNDTADAVARFLASR